MGPLYYCVNTVGLDEEKIRRYVKFQEENERLEPPPLGGGVYCQG